MMEKVNGLFNITISQFLPSNYRKLHKSCSIWNDRFSC